MKKYGIIIVISLTFIIPLAVRAAGNDVPVKVRWHCAKKELPASVDNSRSVYFPPIINQKGGSCAQASGIGYMFTYEMNRYLNRDASAGSSNLFSYLFTWNFLNGGIDQGGFVDQGLNIAMKYGVMTEKDYGYASAGQYKWASGFDKYLNAMRYRGKNLYEFPSLTDEDLHIIKAYLADKGDGLEGGGILTFSTMSSNWEMDYNYDGPSLTGYHAVLTRLATKGAHALTIAGYDDTVACRDENGCGHNGAFIVVNSWGTSMHDRGRFYMPYYFFLDREPDESVLSSYMTGVDVHVHKPLLVYKIEMDYSSRDDISFVMGASDKSDASYPKDRYKPLVFLNQGGDYPMQGAYPQNNNIEIALDYTDHLPSEDYLHPKYFLNIIRSQRGSKKGGGSVKHISLLDYRVQDGPGEYVCKDAYGKNLEWGENLFEISTRPLMIISANHYRLFNSDGDIERGRTHVIRTARGGFAKMRVVGYDRATGKLTIQYRYNKNGSRRFANE